MEVDFQREDIGYCETVPKVSLRQLTYFLAAANHQSVLRAAEALNVSSPSISTAIAQIEKLLDVHLFIRRHARGLVLTQAGRDLAAHARSLIIHAREIETTAHRSGASAAAQFNVGCQATLAPYLLPLLMRDIEISHPKIQLRWSEDNHERLLEAVHSGGVDFVIVYDYDLPSTLHVTPLREIPMQVVLPANHRLATRPHCTLDELANEPMILLDHPKTRDYFLSTFGEAGIEPRIAHRTPSYEMVRGLVANGFGYSLLNFCPPHIVDGQNRIVSIPLLGIDKPQNLVLARLYRFRAPLLLNELITSITTSLASLKVKT